MSAIWGLYSFRDDSTINVHDAEQTMRAGYKRCVIDRIEHYQGDHVALGCGIQYFTPEAENEKLPIVDRGGEIYFTADVMLDNREELLERLGYGRDGGRIADGTILYELFLKEKEKCLDYVLGVFSFVYIDKIKNEVYLVADYGGNRCLHFYQNNQTVYFSTLIEPIIAATGAKQLNKQWITDFLALDNMAYAIGDEETPYLDIYRVPAGNYIKITKDSFEKVRYWNPKAEDVVLKSDDDYRDKLIEVYTKSVNCLMRNNIITMFLSGGMDSTSVACFAAKEALRTGKKLISFTSVPEKEFTSNLSEYYVTDESRDVLKTKKYLEKKGYHLECEMMDLAGKNSWDERKAELDILEIPYKSMQNMLWIKEGMKKSYDRGARVMLMGSYGNLTISNSFTSVYQYELVRKFHFIRLLKDCMGYGRTFGYGMRNTVKTTLQIIRDGFKKKEYGSANDYLGKTFVREELIDRYHVRQRFEQDMKTAIDAKYSGLKAKEMMVNPKAFYQIGESQTKHSLATGVIIRDPTRDKRIIELCMSYPLECYSQKGITRRLIREYLKDELPEHVTKPQKYGLQSADTVTRLQKDGDRIFHEIEEILQSSTAQKYIDTDKAVEAVRNIIKFNNPSKNFEMLRIEYTAMAMEYIADRITDGKMKL